MTGHPPRRSALFVDFDNMFLGLKDDSDKAAERFATSPSQWLHWMEQSMQSGSAPETEKNDRSILIRRCYLNPLTFGKYRPYFVRAGFSVVDCPPLTTGSKNSADIVMVMDMLDTLEHKTHFDEFIIMSADADFTPVFLRLRAHDRRTVAMISTPAAAAYRASCDLLIPEELFVTHALGVLEWGENNKTPQATSPKKPQPNGKKSHPGGNKESAIDDVPANALSSLPQNLVDFILQVHSLTDTPKLSPKQYAAVFHELANELRENGFININQAAKNVRDRCQAIENPVSRTNISWILKGISFGGFPFADNNPPHDSREMANAFYSNVTTLLNQARVEFSEPEKIMLRQWLLGDEGHHGGTSGIMI